MKLKRLQNIFLAEIQFILINLSCKAMPWTLPLCRQWPDDILDSLWQYRHNHYMSQSVCMSGTMCPRSLSCRWCRSSAVSLHLSPELHISLKIGKVTLSNQIFLLYIHIEPHFYVSIHLINLAYYVFVKYTLV